MLSSSKGETESFWTRHCDVLGQKEMQGEPSRKGHSGRRAWREVILVQATKKAREETSKCLMGAEVGGSLISLHQVQASLSLSCEPFKESKLQPNCTNKLWMKGMSSLSLA